MTRSAAPHYILHGMAGSLYTGKVRAYLRQQHIPFVESPAGAARFREEIVPRIGRWIIPVLETPSGLLLQDGSAILDHFEASGEARFSIVPDPPLLRMIAHLFELFGGEGLLRPAMHYRWNFDEENLAFLTDTFGDVLPWGLDPARRAAMFEKSSGRMRYAAVTFGVNAQTAPDIEAAYFDFLRRLNTHFTAFPFLLGGRPSHGDFGLFNPLYAHLARDPAPLRLMQQHAPRVFRWTERMKMPEEIHDEAWTRAGRAWIDPDAVPGSLKSLMAFVADDYLTELTAHVAFANRWLEDHPGLEAGTNGLSDPGTRAIGKATFRWRGHEIETSVMPYRFWLLQRMQDAVLAAPTADRQVMTALLRETGLASLLDLKTHRRVERRNNLEVWGPA